MKYHYYNNIRYPNYFCNYHIADHDAAAVAAAAAAAAAAAGSSNVFVVVADDDDCNICLLQCSSQELLL